MKELVKVVDVYKSFQLGSGSIDVLKGITLDIMEGDFVSIMGASGSGKSTLLYIMGGLDTPTKGNVFLNGIDLSKQSDKQESIMRRRNLSFIFQFYNLVPNLTVEENILLPLVLDGKKKADFSDKLKDILDIVELSHRTKHIPGELSGGQQQRVAIARALISDPEIILADEPIGNLDSKTGMEIMQLFKNINKEKKKTIIQVTHSPEAATYGNTIINMKDGKIFV